MIVSFIPFPARLLAENLKHQANERIAVTIYGCALITVAVLASVPMPLRREEGAALSRRGRQRDPLSHPPAGSGPCRICGSYRDRLVLTSRCCVRLSGPCGIPPDPAASPSPSKFVSICHRERSKSG